MAHKIVTKGLTDTASSSYRMGLAQDVVFSLQSTGTEIYKTTINTE